LSTEPQTKACWKGESCARCKGDEREKALHKEARYRSGIDFHSGRCAGCNGSHWCYCGTGTVFDTVFGKSRGALLTLEEQAAEAARVQPNEPYVPTFPNEPQTFTLALEEFQSEINKALNGKAEDKGYSAGGDSGGRPMLDAVALIAGEGTHPIGEILYKVARWKAKRNPEDLVKVAAWAFLLWDQQKRNGQ
jgi:hypothetical protein